MIRRAFFLLSLFLFLFPGVLIASEGIVIEPAIQKIYLNIDGTPKEEIQKVVIKNTTPLELTFTLRPIEFTDIDKSGGNIFLGQSLSEGEFTEATWINLPESQFLLIPGEQKEITFSIRQPENILPGVHYAAIIFETVRPKTETPENISKVYLRQIATSLLYVSRDSGETQKIEVKQIDRYHSFPRLIDSLVLTFINEGNSFVEPRGFVEVENVFGQLGERSILNEPGKTLFPGQERQIEAKFEKVNYFFPGPYTFHISYRVSEEEYQSTVLTVWYWEPIIVFLGIITIVFIVWLAFLKTHARLRRKR